MPLGTKVGLVPADIALDGDPATPPKKGAEPLPNFRPTSTVAKRLDGSRWHLAWRWIVVQAKLCQMAEPPPQSSAHVYCGQTAGWIKMALGMEMDLDRGHIVLYRDPAPLPKQGTETPKNLFRTFLLTGLLKKLDAPRFHLV